MGKSKRTQSGKPANGNLVKLLPGSILRDRLNTEWNLGNPIGAGGFGDVYLVSKDLSRPVPKDATKVVKVELLSNGPLFVEMNFYLRVGKEDTIKKWKEDRGVKHLGMPQYIGFGSHTSGSERYRFLVLERYGYDINSLFLKNGRRFSLKTVLTLGIQVIDILEYIHYNGYIHADIKGSNLVLGLGKTDEDKVFLLDFGLACLYIDRYGRHKEYNHDLRKAHDGTLEYTSRDAHVGAHSRRGDLEVLGYNLVQWMCGELPWENDLSDPDRVAAAKNLYMSNTSHLMDKCFPHGGAPVVIHQYLRYVAGLGFTAKPDYDRMRSMLRQGMRAADMVDDGRLNLGSIASRKISIKRGHGSDNENTRHSKKSCKRAPKSLRRPCAPVQVCERKTRQKSMTGRTLALRSKEFDWVKILQSHPEKNAKPLAKPKKPKKVVRRVLEDVAENLRREPENPRENPTPAMLQFLDSKRVTVRAASKRSARSDSPTPSNFANLTPAMEEIIRKKNCRTEAEPVVSIETRVLRKRKPVNYADIQDSDIENEFDSGSKESDIKLTKQKKRKRNSSCSKSVILSKSPTSCRTRSNSKRVPSPPAVHNERQVTSKRLRRESIHTRNQIFSNIIEKNITPTVETSEGGIRNKTKQTCSEASSLQNRNINDENNSVKTKRQSKNNAKNIRKRAKSVTPRKSNSGTIVDENAIFTVEEINAKNPSINIKIRRKSTGEASTMQTRSKTPTMMKRRMSNCEFSVVDDEVFSDEEISAEPPSINVNNKGKSSTEVRSMQTRSKTPTLNNRRMSYSELSIDDNVIFSDEETSSELPTINIRSKSKPCNETGNKETRSKTPINITSDDEISSELPTINFQSKRKSFSEVRNMQTRSKTPTIVISDDEISSELPTINFQSKRKSFSEVRNMQTRSKTPTIVISDDEISSELTTINIDSRRKSFSEVNTTKTRSKTPTLTNRRMSYSELSIEEIFSDDEIIDEHPSVNDKRERNPFYIARKMQTRSRTPTNIKRSKSNNQISVDDDDEVFIEKEISVTTTTTGIRSRKKSNRPKTHTFIRRKKKSFFEVSDSNKRLPLSIDQRTISSKRISKRRLFRIVEDGPSRPKIPTIIIRSTAKNKSFDDSGNAKTSTIVNENSTSSNVCNATTVDSSEDNDDDSVGLDRPFKNLETNWRPPTPPRKATHSLILICDLKPNRRHNSRKRLNSTRSDYSCCSSSSSRVEEVRRSNRRDVSPSEVEFLPRLRSGRDPMLEYENKLREKRSRLRPSSTPPCSSYYLPFRKTSNSNKCYQSSWDLR